MTAMVRLPIPETSIKQLKNKNEASVAKKKWIQDMHMKKGALHKEMGVPAGEKIPEKKLAAAAKKGGKEGKRARLAETLKSFHKGK
jgi:hypothetical protein